MILDSNCTLIASLSGAPATVNPAWFVSYADHCRTNAQFLSGNSVGIMAGAARSSLLAPPASIATQRQVKYINFYNDDTSVATVTVGMLCSDVTRNIITQGLGRGESLHYIDGEGWQSQNSAFGQEVLTNFVSISTANVIGTWTSAISTLDAQGLGSTWTISRISSALSIVGNEVWASGTSVGSIATNSYISSRRTMMGVECWSSGVSAKASIGSFSYTSSSRTGMAVEFWSSGISAIASIGSFSYISSSRSVIGAGLWGSGLSIGNATAGGSLIPAISSTSSRCAAFVVNGSSSSFTRIVWAAAQVGDAIITTVLGDAAVSSLSSGLVLHSHCTQAGQIEFRLSNVSTLVQNQSIKTYFFVRISPF